MKLKGKNPFKLRLFGTATFDNFNNVCLGVDDYEWLPDGKGFIASASAD
ncbi:hypothetical protein [Peribacillus glennii]|nr:hypothetical protein [Peribacillus glennii]